MNAICIGKYDESDGNCEVSTDIQEKDLELKTFAFNNGSARTPLSA